MREHDATARTAPTSHRRRWRPLSAVAVMAAMCALASGTAQAAVTLPSGFTSTQWISGLARPYQMQFAPDGRLFVTQQGGALRVIKNGQLLSTPFLTVPVDQQGDRGLIGVAFDPNFATNPYVYVYYTATSPTVHNRVSRFRANGDVAVAGSEQILLEIDTLGSAVLHNGGALHFGKDGKLYITTGENTQSTPAQSMTSLLGKMLRINPDGTIPADNPFYNTASGKYRAIWALGLRNPFTFAVQPGTGRTFINDVGESAWEEINDGIAGSNYGWPLTEGPTTDSRFRSPVFAYAHGSTSTTGCAIAGGTFYNPPTVRFPSDYVGDYFFADNCSGWIRKMDPAAGYAVGGFATGYVGPIDLKTGPDGNLYVLSRDCCTNGNPGLIHRIQYSGTPAITTQPTSQTVAPGQPATFSVTASGLQPLSYQWQRNGVNIAGATSASYTVSSPTLSDNGAQFRVVVSNSLGSATSNAATLNVTNNTAPSPTITTPAVGTKYNAGQKIFFAGTATDPEDGTLPASAFSWEVVFHHNTHTHPGPTIGAGTTGDARSGSFTIPDTGETATDVFYRITLTVRDSGGLTRSVSRDVNPNLSTIALAASPVLGGDGLQVTLDGQPRVTPFSTASVVGMKRTLGVVSPQSLNGTTYQFSSWSDGGAATHTIATPATATTYTARYAVSTAADTTAPQVAVTSPLNGSTVSGTITLGLSATDNVGVAGTKWYVDYAEVEADYDGAPYSKTWDTTKVANGVHTMFAKARDAAGNWGTSAVITFTVSNGTGVFTPDTTITAGPTSTSDTTPDFSFTSSVVGSSFECKVDAGGYAPCTSPKTIGPLTQGQHTFTVRAISAGLTDPTPATLSFTVDYTAPSVSVTSPSAGATVSGTVTLGMSAIDNVGVIGTKWYVDYVEVAADYDGAPYSGTWDTTNVANGTHTMFAKARDAAGNWGTSAQLISFTVRNP